MPIMPLPNVTTADQLRVLHDPPWRHELWRGELRRMTPAGHDHGDLGARLLVRLFLFVERRRLGCVSNADTGFLLARHPDTVLAPDVSFVRAERLPTSGCPGYFTGAPDLAVEVMSPTDTRRRVAAKAQLFLEHGSSEVWVVDPERKTVTVFGRTAEPLLLRRGDTLTGHGPLSGFRLALDKLFDG